MYYEIFEKLCKERGVKPAHVSKETGVSTATLTNWKKGVYTPKSDKLQLIADYFGVSLAYLTGREIVIDTKPMRQAMEAIQEQTAPGLSDVIKMYQVFDDEDREEILTLMFKKLEKYIKKESRKEGKSLA